MFGREPTEYRLHFVSSVITWVFFEALTDLHVWLMNIVVRAEQLSSLAIPLSYRAVLVSTDDVFREIGETSNRRLGLVAYDPEQLLIRLLRFWVGVDGVDADGRKMS